MLYTKTCYVTKTQCKVFHAADFPMSGKTFKLQVSFELLVLTLETENSFQK